MRERSGLKTTEQDQGNYFVQVEESSTAIGIQPARRWLTVAIVFPTPPSENDAKIAAVYEIRRLKARGLDVTIYIHTGDKSNKITWRQTPAPTGKFMVVQYGNATGAITPNWNWGALPDPSAIEPRKPDTKPESTKSIVANEPEPPHKSEPTVRTWTSAAGSFSVDAAFLFFANGSVKLRKADGTEISVPLDKLSEADKAWLEDYKRSKR